MLWQSPIEDLTFLFSLYQAVTLPLDIRSKYAHSCPFMCRVMALMMVSKENKHCFFIHSHCVLSEGFVVVWGLAEGFEHFMAGLSELHRSDLLVFSACNLQCLGREGIESAWWSAACPDLWFALGCVIRNCKCKYQKSMYILFVFPKRNVKHIFDPGQCGPFFRLLRCYFWRSFDQHYFFVAIDTCLECVWFVCGLAL